MLPDSPRKRLGLLRSRNRGGTSDYALLGIEDALARRVLAVVVNDAGPTRFVAKVLKRLGLQGALFRQPRRSYLLALMGPQTFRAFPQGLRDELIIYAFDCWPASYDEWELFFRRYGVRTAFFSARQSATRMGEKVAGLDAIWLPEAIEPSPYRADVPLTVRSIDLLELGRRSDVYHDQVTDHCVQQGYTHLYQAPAPALIFPTREAFLAGLANTKILVCFPSSITHPERAGDVETLTLRYLEGIASGCLLLGYCPEELRTLFGYDPVIPADGSDPCRQLDIILGSLNDFEPLIRRNINRLREVGTWDSRVATMLAILEGKGYKVTDRADGHK